MNTSYRHTNQPSAYEYSQNESLFRLRITGNSFNELYKAAFFLEQLDFESIWRPDETTGFPQEYTPESYLPDVFPTLTAIGMKTSRIKLCTSVVDTLISNPAKTAQLLFTMENLFGERLIIGMGGGEIREPFLESR